MQAACCCKTRGLFTLAVVAIYAGTTPLVVHLRERARSGLPCILTTNMLCCVCSVPLTRAFILVIFWGGGGLITHNTRTHINNNSNTQNTRIYTHCFFVPTAGRFAHIHVNDQSKLRVLARSYCYQIHVCIYVQQKSSLYDVLLRWVQGEFLEVPQ